MDSVYVQLDDTLKAKARLIDFYFVPCSPCDAKYNVLKQLRGDYNISDLQIILVCNGDATPYSLFIEHWKTYKTSGISFFYDSKRMMNKYNFTGYPTELLYNGEELINTDVGFGDAIADRWLKKEREMINQIIKNGN